MNPSKLSSDAAAPHLRQLMYLILVAVGVGTMVGRILAIDAVDVVKLEPYRINRALGDLQKRFQRAGFRGRELEEAMLDARARLIEEMRLRRPFLSGNDRSRWCTVRALVEPDLRVPGAPYAIDRVIQQPGWDTIDMVKHDGHLYSSKPPLFPTLMAAQYWVIHRLTGFTLGTHPYAIGRFMLVTTNVLAFLIYFLVLAGLAERLGRTDFARVFLMAGAVFGTLLTSFVVTINNHLPAAVSAAVLLYAAARIWLDDDRRYRWFLLAGLAGAFMAANELPSLALLAGVGLALLVKAPARTLTGFVPAALVVVVAFFATNYVAHDTLKPAYGNPAWYDYTYERDGRVIESYWLNPQGLDRGEPSRAAYAFHALVGHHGVFSLTPMWLLTVVGLGLWIGQREDRRLRWLALLIAAVSLVVFAFYIAQRTPNRNYGGVSAGLRWMMWFAPLWLVVMLPALDRLAERRWLRWGALVLLGLSAMSAAYPTWNPWTHPWLFDLMAHLGWVGE